MVDSGKYSQNGGLVSDIRSLFSVLGPRRTKVFAYGFVFAFVACTAFIAFNPYGNASPWFNNFLTTSSFANSTAPLRSQFSSWYSYIFRNSSLVFYGGGSPPVAYRGQVGGPVGDRVGGGDGSPEGGILGGGLLGNGKNGTGKEVGNRQNEVLVKDATKEGVGSMEIGTSKGSGTPNAGNQTGKEAGSGNNGVSKNSTMDSGGGLKKNGVLTAKSQTGSGIGTQGNGVSGKNSTKNGVPASKNQEEKGGVSKGSGAPASNQKETKVGSQINAASGKNSTKNGVAPSKKQAEKVVVPKGNGAPASKQNETKSGPQTNAVSGKNSTNNGVPAPKKQAEKASVSEDNGAPATNQNEKKSGPQTNAVSGKNSTNNGVPAPKKQPEKASVSKDNGAPASSKKETQVGSQETKGSAKNPSSKGDASTFKKSEAPAIAEKKGVSGGSKVSNLTASLMKRNGSVVSASNSNVGRKSERWIDSMKDCDIFQGKWVKDESYPLYPEGSCPHIDEPFDCYVNGRPDRVYQKLRWQPNGCKIPRLNATDMLERLRGKRLVFVGDSLNRNMWESLVCALRHSVKDKSKVFEMSGRREFRTEGSYSFLFKDYNCTVEFFRSPFLVQEWEMKGNNGKTKETLRLDIIERSSDKYKDAHVLVFNTGHWWTHEKTSKGKDYYQEGDHIYGELNVVNAFHKALNTWAKWIDVNVNPKKTLVFFRGYSASHFSGGQWNSGGQCDSETEPIKNEKYLSSYPPKMSVLETVLKGMKTPVGYLNITRMTDYRKDAHPSIYRKPNLTEAERRSPDNYQDCSHWCLPGVPDSWNELLYAQLLIKLHQQH